jgi:cold shock protein
MSAGTVKFFNEQRGFGFIAPDGGGDDVFVHARALDRTGLSHLLEGQKVSFDLEPDRKSGKMRATNVQLL